MWCGGNHRKRRNSMISNTHATGAAQEPGTYDLKPPKGTRAGAHRAQVAPKKTKSGKKASAGQKAPKAEKKSKSKKSEARDGSKTAKILDLLKREGGVTQE